MSNDDSPMHEYYKDQDDVPQPGTRYYFERQRAAMEREFGCPIWVTRDMELIPIIEMTPSHLRNAWAYKVKKALKATDEEDARRHIQILAVLEQEFIRRGLPYSIEDFDAIQRTFHGYDYLEGMSPEDFM